MKVKTRSRHRIEKPVCSTKHWRGTNDRCARECFANCDFTETLPSSESREITGNLCTVKFGFGFRVCIVARYVDEPRHIVFGTGFGNPLSGSDMDVWKLEISDASAGPWIAKVYFVSHSLPIKLYTVSLCLTRASMSS
jgi:hypothetical protein